jgi:copper transport protein
MTWRGRAVWALATIVVVLALPALASAHAYLIRTAPAASVTLAAAPASVGLTFDEAIEPRLAIVSVTDVYGQQETAGSARRSPGDPTTLTVPLRRLSEGWYLVYWRAISVDGHPVQGAFTYAVGPSPGPAPQFRVPSVASSAAAPQLLVPRWLMFVTVMAAIGLLVVRLLVFRPLARRVSGVSARGVSAAFVVASILGLIAIPVYLDFSIANDSLRSVFDLPALVPLYGVTAFGRGLLDLELCFALFSLAGWVALRLDRSDREYRSVAELAATTGALMAAAAVLIIPGTAGHAAQTSPRGLTLAFDWLHLVAGSIWTGGLVGLLVQTMSVPARQRVATLEVCVPRFSTVAFGSVVLLAGSGVGEAVDHLPAVNALWHTGYGEAILVKTGLLGFALLCAAGNLLRSRPRLAASREQPRLGEPAGRLLRRLAAGELAAIAAILFAAAVLSSLAPPPPAFALQNSAVASVGPGQVVKTIHRAGYTLQLLVSPNRAAGPDTFALRITRGGRPVQGADVTMTLNHTEMQMPQQQYQLTETRPGLYTRGASALIMVGRWALDFQIAPASGPAFTALILDQANG